MRLNTDDQINGWCSTNSHYCNKTDISAHELRNNITQTQRSRSLIVWHDHGTILELGCLLATVHVATNVTASNGVVIQDKLGFFVGDHPAQQFQRGTQQGGKFKCGGCGVRDTLFGDLAHTLQHPWRSIQDLHNIATAGKFGKSPGKTKPFDNLNQRGATRTRRIRHQQKKGDSTKPTRQHSTQNSEGTHSASP